MSFGGKNEKGGRENEANIMEKGEKPIDKGEL
jgi:hypothetical protein